MLDRGRLPVSYTRELRKKLAESYEQVASGEITPQQAHAQAAIADRLINAVKLDIRLCELSEEFGPLPLEPIIGPITGPPQQLAITKASPELLREQITQLLNENGAMTPAVLASAMKVDVNRLKAALDHAWFEKTPQGYRMAETC